MKNTCIKKRFIAICLVLIFTLSTLCSTNAFAAGQSEIMPLSGTETLPAGEYYIGEFTFTDTNITPVKTIGGASGSKTVWFFIDLKKADSYSGNIKVTVEIRNANTQAVIAEEVFPLSGTAWDTSPIMKVTLNQGDKIQLWFDASSIGTSPGYYRKASVKLTSVVEK